MSKTVEDASLAEEDREVSEEEEAVANKYASKDKVPFLNDNKAKKKRI